jgi:hypothetical protein
MCTLDTSGHMAESLGNPLVKWNSNLVLCHHKTTIFNMFVCQSQVHNKLNVN